MTISDEALALTTAKYSYDERKRLEAENKHLIIDIGTYVELTSDLATENKRLREALEICIARLDNLNTSTDGGWGDQRHWINKGTQALKETET